MPKTKIAVAGAGYIGLAHIDCLRTSATCTLVAIVDPSPAAIAVAAKEGVPLVKTLDELFANANARPDGIILATPNQLHVEQALRCAVCTYNADVKTHIKIPLIANGDIATPEKAKHVLEYTGADAVMIGRAAQGRPWIFREIEYFLKTGTHLALPKVREIHKVLMQHLEDLYEFYGEETGVKVARKHIGWYTKGLVGSASFRHGLMQLQSSAEQMQTINYFFGELATENERLSYIQEELAA